MRRLGGGLELLKTLCQRWLLILKAEQEERVFIKGISVWRKTSKNSLVLRYYFVLFLISLPLSLLQYLYLSLYLQTCIYLYNFTYFTFYIITHLVWRTMLFVFMKLVAWQQWGNKIKTLVFKVFVFCVILLPVENYDCITFLSWLLSWRKQIHFFSEYISVNTCLLGTSRKTHILTSRFQLASWHTWILWINASPSS